MSWGKGGKNLSKKEMQGLITTCLDLGISTFDHADIYGAYTTEKDFGDAISPMELNRSDYQLISKCGIQYTCSARDNKVKHYDHSKDYIIWSVEQSLNNLQTEYLDVLLLHTWTRAWNAQPKALEILHKMKEEGLIKNVGLSTPEHDQNCVIELMQNGLLDAVQVIYNIFEQEPAAQLLPVAMEKEVGIIVRVAFDEGVLTGKYKGDETFEEGDFRNNYYAGDRLQRAVRRTEAIKEDFKDMDISMAELALKFTLAHPATSTVIPGIRNKSQALMNTAVSELKDLDESAIKRLREHAWNRAFWYGGK